MAKSKVEQAFEVMCPDCDAILKIDPVTHQVISHTPAPKKRTFDSLMQASAALKEQDERRDSIFRQSVEAEKNKDDLLSKKFAEAVKKAKKSPLTGKPLREFDLD